MNTGLIPTGSDRGAATAGRPARAPWKLAVLALLLGAVTGALVYAPARWLEPWVARSGYLQLIDSRGTLWSGSARLVLSAGSGSRERAVLPDRVQWQLALHSGGLRLHVHAACCMQEAMQLDLSAPGGQPQLALAPHQSLWPAEPLAALGTPLNTLRPAGRLLLHTQAMQWRWDGSGLQVLGHASLELQDFASALSTLRPMGHYRLELQGGPQPSLSLKTVQGALQLQGQGRWQAGRLRFEGQASAQPEYEAALSNVLNIIGRRSGALSLISIG
jgi:general secretion pathway protein N